MSAAERARELLAYYDSCRARETTVPAVTADTTDVIRDLLAELDQAQELADTMQKWCGKARDERDAALATLAEVREIVGNSVPIMLPDEAIRFHERLNTALDRGPR